MGVSYLGETQRPLTTRSSLCGIPSENQFFENQSRETGLPQHRHKGGPGGALEIVGLIH